MTWTLARQAIPGSGGQSWRQWIDTDRAVGWFRELDRAKAALEALMPLPAIDETSFEARRVALVDLVRAIAGVARSLNLPIPAVYAWSKNIWQYDHGDGGLAALRPPDDPLAGYPIVDGWSPIAIQAWRRSSERNSDLYDGAVDGIGAFLQRRVDITIDSEFVDNSTDTTPESPPSGDDGYWQNASGVPSNPWQAWSGRYWTTPAFAPGRSAEVTALIPLRFHAVAALDTAETMLSDGLAGTIARSKLFATAKNAMWADVSGANINDYSVSDALVRAQLDDQTAHWTISLASKSLAAIGVVAAGIATAAGGPTGPVIGAAIIAMTSIASLLEQAFGQAIGLQRDPWARREPAVEHGFISGSLVDPVIAPGFAPRDPPSPADSSDFSKYNATGFSVEATERRGGDGDGGTVGPLDLTDLFVQNSIKSQEREQKRGSSLLLGLAAAFVFLAQKKGKKR